MPTLHIHLDEAGDWNFNPKGSPYYIIASAWTYDPRPMAEALTALRFSLLRTGTDVESFHAAPDLQVIRNAVVATLVAQPGWGFAAVVLEKRKINPSLRDPAKFYPRFAGALLRFILRGSVKTQADRVLVYADTLPIDTRAKREGVLKAIHKACSDELPNACPHHVYTHCNQSNAWIQVVDYCCWAVHRKWSGKGVQTYDALKVRLAAPELNVTDGGDGTTYY